MRWPMKCSSGVPSISGGPLIENAGYTFEDITRIPGIFLDFFPMPGGRTSCGAKRQRNIYAYGYQLTANGVRPRSASFSVF